MRTTIKTGFATGSKTCRTRKIEAGRFIARPA